MGILTYNIEQGRSSFIRKMKIAVVFLAVAVAYATARRPKPCDGIDNIESCLCGDEASTEVTDPRDCRDVMAKPVSCACVDGSEWGAPEPPCGGRENVAGCAENEETGEAEITCNDGTVEPAPGGRCSGGRGGRGRGRGGRGRGGRGVRGRGK